MNPNREEFLCQTLEIGDEKLTLKSLRNASCRHVISHLIRALYTLHVHTQVYNCGGEKGKEKGSSLVCSGNTECVHAYTHTYSRVASRKFRVRAKAPLYHSSSAAAWVSSFLSFFRPPSIYLQQNKPRVYNEHLNLAGQFSLRERLFSFYTWAASARLEISMKISRARVSFCFLLCAQGRTIYRSGMKNTCGSLSFCACVRAREACLYFLERGRVWMCAWTGNEGCCIDFHTLLRHPRDVNISIN